MNYAVEGIKTVVIAVMVLNLIPLLIWFERKGAAYIQDRRGPNRAHILGIRLGGIIHNIADVLKLITKEDIVVKKASRFFYILAPMLAMFVAIGTVGVIPFADPIMIGDYALKFQIADLNIGFLYILAVASLGVYSVMLAGWSSYNNYSLLGGLRASAQMISYEVAMGLSLVGLLVGVGSVDLTQIVFLQNGAIWEWHVVKYPISFLIFLVALFAETNRTPFDLPEGESEIVAGYHSEYSSMKFALFFMGEYAHIAVGSAFLVALFFGGWQIPFLPRELMIAHLPTILKYFIPLTGGALIAGGIMLFKRFRLGRYNDLRDYEVVFFGSVLAAIGAAMIGFAFFGLPRIVFTPLIRDIVVAAAQIHIFLLKILFFCFVFVWVRWTLPRFRYDQLMKLGWQIMVPLALANIVWVAAMELLR